MASACLPTIFQAVEIDGVPYWDGGYSGNPALFPLFYATASDDVILVQINPIERKTTPRTAREIQNRLTEINFNSGLLRELRAVDFVTRLIDDGKLSQDEYKRVLMHRIDADKALKTVSAASRTDAEWGFFLHLRDLGRKTAHAWLKDHYDDLGKRSTLDLRSTIS
jgi:NTE family protein